MGESRDSSAASYGDGASPDERILSSVPQTISDTLETAEQGPAQPGELDPVAGLMAMVAFEEEDVRDTLCELFEWLSERFKSNHWKLTERQARMMGKPGTMLVNALWQRLQTYLPDVLGRWCETTPGALAFLTACGLVVAPKIMEQVRISRERKAAQPVVTQMEPQSSVTQPATPTSGAVVWSREVAA